MAPAAYLKAHIRTMPDWPAPGVQFRDITPLLQDPKVFRVPIDRFVHRYMDAVLKPTVAAGLDARGFIIGSVVAYEREYGSATAELHTDG
jgi:adenine phosphoribosyltransferase